MDSPSPNPGASAQPLTPPGDGAASHRASTSAPTQQQQSPGPNKTTGTNNANANANSNTNTTTTAPTTDDTLPQFPATSLEDDGKSRRPRDVRLMHMLLASQGVTAYQERVPLQLLDFAYRYTSATLQDAVYLVTEGYPGEAAAGGGGGRGGEGGGGSSSKVIHHDVNSVSLAAVRMSIASRLHYQFQPSLPKEFLLEMAAERNRVVLPGAVRGADVSGVPPTPTSNSVLMGGIRLPPERFCQTGVGWDMNEEWESEGEEEVEADQKKEGEATGGESKETKKEKEEDEDEEMEDDDGDGRMEDIFGDDTMNKDGAGADEDRTMSGM